MSHKKLVLLIGFQPEKIQWDSIPEYPQDPTTVGVYNIINQLKEAGYDAEVVLVDQGETAIEVATKAIQSRKWDFVCIGAGVRKGPKHAFLIFEQLCNLIHEYAPQAKLCFNESPQTSVEAVKRWDV